MENPLEPAATGQESSLAGFCGRLIEACWLVAAGVLPLLMDPLAVHRFQPIKMGVLNSLGLISMMALAVRLADGKFRRNAPIPAWLAATLVLVVSFIASTALSVTVEDSLWGGDPFLQGSFGLFCQLGLFVGVAVCLRRREQWDRLIAIMLAASLPLALVLIYQRFGWDPSSSEASVLQFNSFGGHPAFTAGTLLMMIPLCGWKFFSSLASTRGTGGVRPFAAVSFYGILLTIQIAAVIVSDKRGPFLGLLAAAAAAAVLHAVCGKRVRSALAAMILTAAAMLTLTALALWARENPTLRQLPVIERLAMIVPVGEGSGDGYRKNLWEKAPAILLGGGSKTVPDRETDPWSRIRLLVGYGPESLPAFLPQFVFLGGPAGPDSAIESRFHNAFWDRFQNVGLLGLAATFALQTLVFSRGLRALRLHQSAANPRQLAGMALVLGCGMGLLLELLFGRGYFGLGFQVGFAGGLLAWPLLVVWRHPDPLPRLQIEDSWERPLGIALLSGLVAHWVDMAFLFPTANTAALNWVCAGALVALGRPRGESDAPAMLSAEVAETRSWLRPGLVNGILAGGITVALVHAFITYYFTDAQTTGAVLESTLTRLLHNKAPSHLILLLLLPAYLAANLLLLTSRQNAMKGAESSKTLAVSCIVSLGITAAWAAWKAGQIAALGPLPQSSTPLAVMIRQSAVLENLALGFFLIVVMIPFAVALLSGCRQPGSRRPRVAAPALLVAAVGTTLCAAAIRFTQVPVLLNEAVADYARGLGSMNLVPATAEFYQRAAGHAPRDLNSRIQGTKALIGVAEKSTDTQEYLGILRKAEAFLQSGLKHGDRNVLNYYHANVLMRQALEMPAGAERVSTAQRAHAAYAAALRYAPNTEVAWFERSLVEKELLGDKAAADASLARADEIAETVDSVIFADQYAYQMQTTVSPALNPAYGKRGVEYYTRALKAPGGLPPAEQARLLIAKGTLLVNLRLPGDARECLLQATQAGETPELWRAHAILAELSLKARDLTAAGFHLDEAIRRAPDETRRNLQQFKARISR
jgi:tetratricopeptide (TPR) repeat protein